MLKKDKEIKDTAAIEDILSKALVCRLGLCENNRPYVVPLCYGYKDNVLYFHCAMQGKKMDIIKKNNNVCFEIATDLEVVRAAQLCKWDMKYKSVIGFGKAVFIENTDLKRKALDIIIQQYSGKSSEYPQDIVNKTTIVKVEIESMTGKQSG